MKLSNKYFPYPVITYYYNDYSNSIFDCEMQVSRNINTLEFLFNITNTDNVLCSMLSSGDVEYVIHFECPQTSYRNIIKSDNSIIINSILENKLQGKLYICVLIVAKKDIRGYSNDNFNLDYNGFSFDFKRGSIMGVSKEFEVPVIKNVEEFEKVPSIFVIAKDMSSDTSGMKIELGENKIKIFLNESDFSMYNLYSKSPEYSNIVNCILILPALVYTFNYIKNELDCSEDDLASYRWYQVIEHALEKKGLELNKELLHRMESYELAQKILDLPVERAFKSISTISTLNEEEEN